MPLATHRRAVAARPGARTLGLVAAALLGVACGARSAAPPRPTGLSPGSGAPTAPVAIRIRGTFGAEVSADFSGGAGDVVDARFQARLGTTPLDDVALRQDGALDATVPAGLAPGTYDLTVVDPAGRTGALAQAFRVLAPGAPAVPVAAFRVDAVGPQTAYAPFTATITALDATGAAVVDWMGEAQLSDRTGTVTPSSVGPFVDGRWSGAVEVRAGDGADVLTVTEAGGAIGAAPLAVAPAPAAAVRFTTAPPAAQAGACTGPIGLALRDAFGQPTTAAGALALSVGATPAAGVTLHADAGCSAALATPTVAAGQGTLSLWLVATAAGALRLAASGAALVGDAQAGTVAAGPPARLAFVTPPQALAAAACSGAVIVEAQDAWENPAPLSTATVVALAAPGLTLHAGAGCGGSGVAALTIPAGATRATFSFRGSAAGRFDVAVHAAGLAGATQGETLVLGTASALAFTTAPQAVTADVCSGAVTVQSRDAAGDPAPISAGAATTVTVAGAGLTVYAGAGCAGAPVGSVLLPAGATAVTVSFRGTGAGSHELTASAPGVAPARQDQLVVAATASRLAFPGAARTATAGACSAPVTVEVRDAWGNPAPVPAALPVDLAAPGLVLYEGTGCAGAPVTAVRLAAGAAAATFSFTGTVAGAHRVDATATGLAGASQGETIAAGPTDRYAWSEVASPQPENAAFTVTIAALDVYGNRTADAGPVALSASSGSVRCASACTSAAVTGAFTDGRWTGGVLVPAAARDLTLTATGPGGTGTSNPFDVGGAARRSPPVARYVGSARVITSGSAVTFDASASSDLQTPAAALAVSWSFEARDADQGSTVPPGTPPSWTEWSGTRTATHAFVNNTGAPIVYRPRLAVRDAETGPGGPDVGYASGVLVVLPNGSNVCVVDTDSLADDNGGSASCDVKGGDGRTSLAEAIRAANALPAGTMNVVFSGARHLVSAGGTTFWLNAPVRILASPGTVTLDGVSFSIHAAGVHLAGLELTHLAAPLLVDPSGDALLEDLRVHDGQGIEVQGRARLLRVAMSACSGGACLRESGWSAYLAVFFSDLAGAGSGVGVALERCQGGTPSLLGLSPYDPSAAGWPSGSAAVVGTVVTGFETGVSVGSGCAHAVVANDTFDGNGVGLDLGAATTGHVGDNVFSHQTVAAVAPASCAVDLNTRALVHENASDGCVGDAASLRTGDPLYVDPAARDFRIQLASPARDAGGAFHDAELDDAGPGLHLGAAPDRGGRETW